MRQYLAALTEIINDGTRQKNRTGIDTFMIPGITLKFDLRKGFPILTTKKVNFGAIASELCGFIRGYDTAADFREVGTKIWDANANENKQWLANPNRRGEDDLGRVYGVQWRRWRKLGKMVGGVCEVEHVDQIENVLRALKNDPTSRRIIVTAWNPAELDQMALPPCHLLHQYLVEQETNTLHMTMYQRSCDMFLGVPFNISSYALLLSLVARVSGYTPGTLTMFLADAHIYENHLKQVIEQLSRDPRPLPALSLNIPHPVIGKPDVEDSLDWLENVQPYDMVLEGYVPHPPIKAEMAV